MTRTEYVEYKKAVADFMEKEGITNLTSESGDEHDCPICGGLVDGDEHFSWTRCDCCDRNLGGSRYHATGYNPTTKEGQCYEICTDCVYYGEYGQLDDMTMLEVEKG